MTARRSTDSTAAIAARAQIVGVLGALVERHLADVRRAQSTGGGASVRRASEMEAREMARLAMLSGRRVAGRRNGQS